MEGETSPVAEEIRNKVKTIEMVFMRRSLQITTKGKWMTQTM